MASIGNEGERGELKRIMFRDAVGKQQSLRLGKCSQRNAQLALAAMEHLLEAKQHDAPPHHDAVRWLDKIDDRLHGRVVALGLTKPRDAAVVTLGMLLDQWNATAAVKPSTRAAYKQTVDSLLESFGADARLGMLTTADADAWRKSIAEPVKVTDAQGKETTKRLAPATVAKRVHVARAIFKRAVRWGYIPSSPFAELRAGSQSNPDRSHYIGQESIHAILDACPNNEWRAVVALSRFAGLRCPSEVGLLRWGDVNWESGRLTVRSPKTAGHEGHAVRIVPIVPRLRAILQDLFDHAEVGAETVVPRLRDPAMNLRTTFGKIIARAGLKPWPRLFHNLRASCACDWVEDVPAHVVAGWLGHSPTIAARHYLQTRDAHFDLAVGGAGGNGRQEAATNPATNPATQVHARALLASQAKTQNPQKPAGFVGFGVVCDPVQNGGMGEVGFEPTKAKPTDLQSVLVDRLSIRPQEGRSVGISLPGRNRIATIDLDGRQWLVASHDKAPSGLIKPEPPSGRTRCATLGLSRLQPKVYEVHQQDESNGERQRDESLMCDVSHACLARGACTHHPHEHLKGHGHCHARQLNRKELPPCHVE